MNVYLFSLLLGFVGLLVMAVSGVAGSHGHAGGGHGGHLHGHDVGDVNVHGIGGGHAHVGGHLHAGHAGHAGGAHAGGHAVAHGHGHAAHGHAQHGHGEQGHAGDVGKAVGGWFLSFLSPRALFSVLVGVGAAGLLLGGVLSGPLLTVAAIVAGVLFEVAAVRPVWNFFFRFGSEPALTLESAITDTATAVTSFNPQGEGVVKIELDGQIVQVLARLAPADLQSGVRVRSGDSLVVEEVDAVRNRCVVSLPVSAGTIRGA
ncbi:MAG TPA: hypothetical protein VFJ16_07450 [Longimicrobium sp.]|nr:hypothetical protein [Longimicrobium sp.]